ncbi:hypothetical protein [Streptomyces swartbergensis]|uniref:Uncharacterized protein n=1 Tax=Streptomyces swartbergensis TaxID=487165 RepID=A0A243SAA7_9ACTN|nr:hypothetical protein [Streptomyces swartbergensis]OUD04655.1 hypothetical protein CA983_02550 [Streptomyces swartbergensis]
MSPFISDADLASTDMGVRVRSTTTIADLFGDELDRALHRESAYAVPLDQRQTCPIHLDWVTGCAELHLDYPAAA